MMFYRENVMKKTILVTGGAGFIASHLVDAYIAAGHKVVVVDNLWTGKRRNLNPKAKFYKADIRNLEALRKIFKKEKPSIVSHHAALVEVVKSLRDPINTFAVNVDGTVNLLMCSGENRVKKFIFASTAATYGEPKKMPVNENTPTVPISPYGLTKLLAEECIKYYASFYGFSYTIFRYTNVFGKRQNPHGEAGIVAIFTDLMKAKKRPTIFGDGTKTRDYIFVVDVVRANKKALTEKRSQLMNLGWGKEIRDREMYDAIAEIVKFKEEPFFKPVRAGEVIRFSLDARRAKKIFGWEPKTSLKAGLRQTLS